MAEIKEWTEWWKSMKLQRWPAYNLATGRTILVRPGALPQQYGFGFRECDHAGAWSFQACEACARKLAKQTGAVVEEEDNGGSKGLLHVGYWRR